MTIATFGYIGVLVGLASAGYLVVLGVRAARQPESVGRSTIRPAVLGLLAGAATAFASLELAIIGNDFSVKFVAEHSARSTPFLFKLATAWAALEGSIVLWGLVLAIYTAFVFRQFRDGDRLGAGALAVMGAVAVFFFGAVATIANPFTAISPVPVDGPGPNPLLQNHVLMAVHPPLLYAGYVGFTVPFAFAIAALALGQRGPAWVTRTQRWTLVAWCFLTAGITCGAWWSYAVLGWGGYWGWDPVENASFLPWLVGTAYIHSAVIQARRGLLQAWSIALIISTFALTILGTFLTRSGVIASVHSFTQSSIGPALLAFLAVIVIGSFGLFAARAHLVASSPRLESLASREGSFLFNNMLLTVFAFTVLSGTLYPLLVEALTGDQVSVGRPFFDRLAIPLALALLLMMGLGPLLPYRAARPQIVWERIRWPLRAGLAVGALCVLTNLRQPYVVLVLMVGTAIAFATARQLWQAASKVKADRGIGRPAAAVRVLTGDPGFWGGQVAHLGFVLVAIGIATSGNLATRATLTLHRGQPVKVAGYELTFRATTDHRLPNRAVRTAEIDLRADGHRIRTMTPKVSQFDNQVQAVATPSIYTTLGGDDVYLSLNALDGDLATVHFFRYPKLYLLWIGGFLTAAGGLFSLAVRRRRRHGAPTRDPAGDAAPVDTRPPELVRHG